MYNSIKSEAKTYISIRIRKAFQFLKGLHIENTLVFSILNSIKVTHTHTHTDRIEPERKKKRLSLPILQIQ